ncbi:hypothetical protein Tco_0180057 [Tanacetum coccineum]
MIVQIKNWLKTARSRQKSYADVRRKPMKFQVGDMVMLKVSPWKGVIRFGKRGKLSPRNVWPDEKLVLSHFEEIPTRRPNFTLLQEPVENPWTLRSEAAQAKSNSHCQSSMEFKARSGIYLGARRFLQKKLPSSFLE